ncbi:MAG: 23S rRNA (guanosine(2251)-2'-O)-methyltransferase RlmB [Turicibacter sp.]
MAKKDNKREVIYGKNTVAEVIESKRTVYEVIVTDMVSQNEKDLMKLIAKKNIELKVLPKNKFEQLAKDKYDVRGNHQGIMAAVEPYAYMPLPDLIAKATSKDEPAFIIILDGLEDPHNLGAILRTADAAGVDGIVIRKDRSVGLTNTVAKLSTGAIEHIPVACVANLTVAINQMKDAGMWIAGTDASEAQDYRTIDATLPLGLVIGSEGKGMSRLVREACDFLVYLPMRGHVTSLNASVAAALLIYEVYNKRNPLVK